LLPQALHSLLASANIKLLDHTAIPASGGDRQYYRLQTSIGNLIAANSSNLPETNTFLAFSNTFAALNLPVPKILAISEAKEWYIQSDAGSDCLLDTVLREGISENVKSLYQQAVKALPKFQINGHATIDYNLCLVAKQFDAGMALFDLNYFMQYYISQTNIVYNEALLQEEFKAISQSIGGIKPQYFMYRDLQGRNIMVDNNVLTFIDYQGGMQGPLQYDLASLLWQAKAQLPADLKQELLEIYFEQANALCENNLDKNNFLENYYNIVMMRLLQVLGAYGRRGLIEGKQHFISSIPAGLQNVKDWMQLQDISNKYPELHKILKSITNNI
jgi:aminoglycoside/choline kinase family phosphotransferase